MSRNPRNPDPRLKTIQAQLAALEQRLRDSESEVRDKFRDLAEDRMGTTSREVEIAFNKREREFNAHVDDIIGKRLSLTWAVAALLIVVLGAIGYIAVIPNAVNSAIGGDVRERLKGIESQARNHLQAINEFKEAAKPQPSIVLQTDYGLGGPYMPALKGVILSKNPYARVDVLCSTIDPFDVTQAAWFLWRACRNYPEGTIFVCITNPGGITRDQVVLETMNGLLFIGHDNGCFDFVAQHLGVKSVHKIGSTRYSPKKTRDPFGGVDTIGPVAADLSKGLGLNEVGPLIDSYTPKLLDIEHAIESAEMRGTVMSIDVYGNITLNISQTDCESQNWRMGQTMHVSFNGGAANVAMPLRATYGDVSKQMPLGLYYDGLLQLAINEGNFAEEHKVRRGQVVSIRRQALHGS